MSNMGVSPLVGIDPSVADRFKASLRIAIKRMQVPQDQILDIVTQLAIMFETGLNLSAALEVLEKQAATPQQAEFVGSIRRGVENGKPLSAAMALEGWAFSPVALALVRAGEMTGDLGAMLQKVAEFMERDISTRKKVRSAMSYPAFMAVMAACTIIFLLVNVFPKFAELFGDQPDKLPGPTRFFLDLSDILRAHGAWLLPAMLVGLGACIWGARSREGKRIFDPLYLKVPAFGKLIKAVSISRSFHVLGVMMNAGLNVLEALQLAADVSGNHRYVELWDDTRKKVENGHDISETLMDNPLIPPAEAAMISLGERSGTLPTVLEKITSHHEKKVESAIKAFVAVIEPAMTILMGAVVALIVSSLIMPMFAISQVMK
ncbi:MAG: type II secretion system F family protein [Planctomycetota bacterium]|jgi:type IV pilus assembly protein PilC|nr:type II secretion system F family protein [Planctomycetota bacterium]